MVTRQHVAQRPDAALSGGEAIKNADRCFSLTATAELALHVLTNM